MKSEFARYRRARWSNHRAFLYVDIIHDHRQRTMKINIVIVDKNDIIAYVLLFIE